MQGRKKKSVWRLGLKILTGLLLVLAVLSGGGIVYLTQIDINDYKAEIEEAARDATGRSFSIAGPMALDIGFETRLEANDITLGNAPWAEADAMLQVARLEVVFAPLSLLGNRPDIRDLQISGVRASIENDPQHGSNLDFAASGDGAGQKADRDRDREKGKRDRGSGDFHLPKIRNLEITDVEVRVADGSPDQVRTLRVNALQLSGGALDAPLDLTLDARYADLDFDLSGRLGAPALIDGGRDAPWPLDVSGSLAGIAVSAKGTITDPVDPDALDITLSISGDDLGPIAEAFAIDLPTRGPVTLEAQLNATPDTSARIDIATLKLGGSDLAGRLSVERRGKGAQVTGELSSRRMDSADFTLPARDADTEDGAGEGDEAKYPSRRLFSDESLPFHALSESAGRISYRADVLVLNGLTLQDAALDVTLKDGALTVDPLTAGLDRGRIDLSLALDGAARPPTLGLRATTDGADFGRLLGGTALKDGFELPGALDIALDGAGASPHALVSGLDGTARLVMADGRIRRTALKELLGADAAQLAELFSGAGEWLVVNCMILDYAIEDGVATTKAAFLDTDVAALTAEGTIDLGAEQLDLLVTPQASVISLPLRVSGPLTDPGIFPDPERALLAIGGGLMTGGGLTAALALMSATLPAEHACVTSGARAQEAAQSGEAGGLGNLEGELKKQLGDGAGKALGDAVGKGLKKLLGN